VRVEMKGFKATALEVVVQVNTTAAGNVRLEVGASTEVVEVTGSEVLVNTSQSTVQGVLTSEQIENLPINGRNFLDLAQLEPGVQIQDGGTFDPTKNGFSSVSFGGRFGRTARIEVDGIDISDETVGTTTQNLPLGAIHESALQQSSLDLSTELTSSGSVNVLSPVAAISALNASILTSTRVLFGMARDGILAILGSPLTQAALPAQRAFLGTI